MIRQLENLFSRFRTRSMTTSEWLEGMRVLLAKDEQERPKERQQTALKGEFYKHENVRGL